MDKTYVRLEIADGDTDNPISIANAIISHWYGRDIDQIDRLECVADVLLNYCSFVRKQNMYNFKGDITTVKI